MHLTNRAVEAEPLLERVVSVYEKNFGPNHIQVADALFGLAVLRAERGDWPAAVELGRRAISIVTSHGQDVFAGERDRVDGDEAEAAGRPHVDSSRVADKTNAFRTHTRALYRSGPDDRRAQEEGFEAAQWALQTDAAHALAQMSARFALGSTPLAAVVREQQDLIARRQAEDSRLLAAIGRGDTHLTEQSRATLSEISAKLSSIDIRLGTEFPQYADLSEPKPLSIADTQLLLARDEALMLFLDIPRTYSLPEESLGFLVTRETFRWFRIPIGPRALGSQVAALRCGLDETLWLDATDWPQATEDQLRQRTAQIAHRKRCEALLKATPRAEVSGLGPNQVLPFDLERANKLYQALFGQIEELIKNKHLLIVPAGPLTALPFHILTTQKPRTPLPTQSDGYGDAAWLAKSNAITVLPSVASLKAVRSIAKTSKATSSFIGFGDPLLVGPSGTDKRAWTRQNCTPSGSAPLQIAARSSLGPIPNFFRGRLADVQLIRHQYPLPETADELCAVAHAIGAPESSVFLGEKATETIIKDLSASGKLSDVHVVHFATHGLLASESSLVGSSVAEPALILTPPAVPTEADDGLLTASEVAQLKLDADWVVLSACNTAAGETDKPDAQALSGLARAFFYAGARALLVSHWAVDSQATVSLITRPSTKSHQTTLVAQRRCVGR